MSSGTQTRRTKWSTITTGGALHHGAGVAARLAAVPDQEGPVSLAAQQRLGLRAVDVAQTPQTLVMVREVLLVLHHAVLTDTHTGQVTHQRSRSCRKSNATQTASLLWYWAPPGGYEDKLQVKMPTFFHVTVLRLLFFAKTISYSVMISVLYLCVNRKPGPVQCCQVKNKQKTFTSNCLALHLFSTCFGVSD